MDENASLEGQLTELEARGIRFGRLARRFPVLRGLGIALGPYRKQLLVLALLAAVAAVLDTLTLYFVARLALVLANGDETVPMNLGPGGRHTVAFEQLIMATIAVLILAVIINWPLSKLAASISRRALLRARSRLLNAYLSASWAYRSLQPEGHLQEMTMSYGHMNESVIPVTATLIVAVLGLLALAVAAVAIAGWIAIVASAGLLLLAASLRPLATLIRRSSHTYAELNREYASSIAQTARLSPEVQTFDVGAQVEREQAEDAVGGAAALEKVRLVGKLTPALFQYTALGLIVGVIWLLWAVAFDDLSVIGPLILLLVRALAYARQLQSAAQSVVHYSPYVERLELEIATLEAHPIRPGTVGISTLGAVTFDDVDYAYVQGHPVLENVDLELLPGEAVGIVGPSGGGKSTLTQLLLRLREPSRGRILVDGIDLQEIQPGSWSRVAALVPQENRLIRGSVADNIRFHRRGFTRDRVKSAAQSAHLHDEIVALPNGYDTEIGPGARDLSGGQRQRLGIARALLGQPQMLVLDEPTSALDVRSERLIRQTLAELRGSTTLVVVAHRPATLQVCDRVVRVERGRVTIESSQATRIAQ